MAEDERGFDELFDQIDNELSSFEKSVYESDPCRDS
jgi:hypothetical protein